MNFPETPASMYEASPLSSVTQVQPVPLCYGTKISCLGPYLVAVCMQIHLPDGYLCSKFAVRDRGANRCDSDIFFFLSICSWCGVLASGALLVLTSHSICAHL